MLGSPTTVRPIAGSLLLLAASCLMAVQAVKTAVWPPRRAALCLYAIQTVTAYSPHAALLSGRGSAAHRAASEDPGRWRVGVDGGEPDWATTSLCCSF